MSKIEFIGKITDDTEKHDRWDEHQRQGNHRGESGMLHAQSEPSSQAAKREPGHDEQHKNEQHDSERQGKSPLQTNPADWEI